MNTFDRILPILLVCLAPLGVAADEARALDAQSAEMRRLASANPAVAEGNVAGDFSTLAGSDENARRLVAALRTGNNVDFTWQDKDGKIITTTIDPATGRMGLGNVFISLALARESLKQAGVVDPTPDQLNAALSGGTVIVGGRAIELTGVLAQRSAGAGWGRIAQSLGVKLGAVVSAIKSENGRLRAAEASRRHTLARAGGRREISGRADPAERGGKPERAGGPDRPDRPERPAKPERPGRPERIR